MLLAVLRLQPADHVVRPKSVRNPVEKVNFVWSSQTSARNGRQLNAQPQLRVQQHPRAFLPFVVTNPQQRKHLERV